MTNKDVTIHIEDINNNKCILYYKVSCVNSHPNQHTGVVVLGPQVIKEIKVNKQKDVDAHPDNLQI